MRRRDFITLVSSAAVAWPRSAHTQRLNELRRLGVMLPYAKDSSYGRETLATFQEALTRLGWSDGKNLSFEYRWVGSSTELMQSAAKELVAMKPALIVVFGSSPSTGILLRETRTIPILFINIVDPVGQGFVASLSHPGGNATGLVNLEPSMAGKWLGLLKEIVPPMERVTIAINPASSPYADIYLKYFESAAPSFGVRVASAPIIDVAAFEAVAAQARDSNSGIVLMPSAFMSAHTVEIAQTTTHFGVPAIDSLRSFPDAGGLLSYGNDVLDNYRQAGSFADRILKGENPSNIPVQFPTKFELVINRKTATTLGLTIPQTLLATADNVIE
jgi:putative tryptophan/tyrosine transport system substrate-binding protein